MTILKLLIAWNLDHKPAKFLIKKIFNIFFSSNFNLFLINEIYNVLLWDLWLILQLYWYKGFHFNVWPYFLLQMYIN